MSNRLHAPQYTASEILGPDFEANERLIIGSVNSAHEVEFGHYNEQDVVAKPFVGKNAVLRANNEFRMEKLVDKMGIRTVNPLEIVVPNTHDKVAVLISEYMPGLKSADTLSVSADLNSEYGKVLIPTLGSIAIRLGRMHGMRITHGDPQLKNFGFLEQDMAKGIINDPVVFDLERGSKHGKDRKGNHLLELSAKKDLKKMAHSFAINELGGLDPDVAADAFEEVVLKPYAEQSPALRGLGKRTVTAAVNEAYGEFIEVNDEVIAYEQQKERIGSE